MRPAPALIALFAAALAGGACTYPGSSTTDEPAPVIRRASLLPLATQSVKAGAMDKLLGEVDAKLSSIGKRGSYRYMRAYPAQKRAKGDKTLAPYFHIPGKKSVESLPLKQTSAKVHVAGVIAHVKVRQLYENTGKQPIEATYVFPASTRAAVHGMRMKIGKRTVVAKIQERGKARRTYQKAREAGKRTSLLEQQRPNVFTMSVANIMPGDKIAVELDYSELLVPKDGVYELVYPTVVGPRYGGGANPRTDKWIANPYLKAGSKVPYKFAFSAHVESPIGIAKLSSPSHEMKVAFKSRKSADVTLPPGDGGNRDVVLRYRLAGGKIETGVLQYVHNGEKYFLVMMEPPKRVKPKQVPSREYILVVDVSGSMYGFPLETTKQLLRKLFRGMTSRDYFNVILFAGSSVQMHERSVPATAANLQRAIQVIDRQRGGGGTQLLGALKHAYRLPRLEAEGVSRSVLVITDGYVGVEAQTFRYIRKRLNQANVFGFGIGSSVNRGLIEGMARAGMGQPFVVLQPSSAEEQAEKFKTYVEAPVLTGIKVTFDGVKVSDVAPASMPDLFAQRPLILFGKYQGSGKLKISGFTGQGKWSKTLALSDDGAKAENEPVRILWARKWVEVLMDQYAVLPGDAEIEKAVTSVGLGYHLLTRFTSFVAVDSEIARESGQKLISVKQPLPLPKGVSNYAVGGTKNGILSVLGKSTASGGFFGSGSGGGGIGHGRGNLRFKRRSQQRLYAQAPAPVTAMPVKRPAADPSAARDEKDSDGQVAQTESSKPAERGADKAGGESRASLRVLRAENLRADRKARVLQIIKRIVRRCLRRGARAGRWIRVTITTDGRVRISGLTGACVAQATARLRILTAFADTSRPVRIVLKLR